MTKWTWAEIAKLPTPEDSEVSDRPLNSNKRIESFLNLSFLPSAYLNLSRCSRYDVFYLCFIFNKRCFIVIIRNPLAFQGKNAAKVQNIAAVVLKDVSSVLVFFQKKIVDTLDDIWIQLSNRQSCSVVDSFNEVTVIHLESSWPHDELRYVDWSIWSMLLETSFAILTKIHDFAYDCDI